MEDLSKASKALLNQSHKYATQGDLREFADQGIQNTTQDPKNAQNGSRSWFRMCDSSCEVCRGIGWLRLDLNPGDKGFGDMVPCPNSAGYINATRSGLDEEEWYKTWSSIADINNAGEAINAVRQVIDRGFGWVYLWGKPGLAKTLILKVAIAESLRLGRPSSYVRMIDIIESLKKSFDKQGSYGDDIRRLEKWSDLRALSIDEFDRIQSTEWADNRKFMLLDNRYEGACKRSSVTIFASNADPSKFEDYIASRIFDGRFFVVKLEGSDARPQMLFKEDQL